MLECCTLNYFSHGLNAWTWHEDDTRKACQLNKKDCNWVTSTGLKKMHKSERPGIALWVNIVSDRRWEEFRWAAKEVRWGERSSRWVEEELKRIEKTWEGWRRGETCWEELRKAEKKWKELRWGGRDGTTLRAVGSCSCWKELQKLRQAEMVWEDLKSGGRNWKGRRQNDVELKEQSCEAVRSVVAAPIGKTCFQDPIAAHFL